MHWSHSDDFLFIATFAIVKFLYMKHLWLQTWFHCRGVLLYTLCSTPPYLLFSWQLQVPCLLLEFSNCTHNHSTRIGTRHYIEWTRWPGKASINHCSATFPSAQDSQWDRLSLNGDVEHGRRSDRGGGWRAQAAAQLGVLTRQIAQTRCAWITMTESPPSQWDECTRIVSCILWLTDTVKLPS